MTALQAARVSILRFPRDDHQRLVYAEMLECEPVTVECEKCHGQGWYYDDSGGNIGVQRHCDKCNSTGYRSNGNSERCALIRVQWERQQIEDEREQSGKSGFRTKKIRDRHDWLRSRERELIAFGRDAGWWEVPGVGVQEYDGRDSVVNWWVQPGGPVVTATVRLGFIDSISLPSAAFTEQLARAVASEHPLTKVTLTDAEPWNPDSGLGFCWYKQSDYPDRSRPSGTEEEGVIADEIWEWLPTKRWEGYAPSDTRELALTALSNACVDYARSLVQLPGGVTLPPLYRMESVR